MIDYTTNVQQNNGLQWTLPGSAAWSAASAGGCSGQISLSGVSIQPVEQMIPMSWYGRLGDLWFEAKEENKRLRKRIAELEAQLTQE